MSNNRYISCYILVLLVQLVLARYCQWSLVYISLLPAMMLCIPTIRPTWWTLFVAFATGLAVDAFADGALGLNAVAVIPAAALRKYLIRTIIDEDIVDRYYSLSFKANGYISIGLVLGIVYAVFFIIYVFVDSAGMRSFGFCLTKFVLSWLTSMVFGMIVTGILCPYQRR